MATNAMSTSKASKSLRFVDAATATVGGAADTAVVATDRLVIVTPDAASCAETADTFVSAAVVVPVDADWTETDSAAETVTVVAVTALGGTPAARATAPSVVVLASADCA